jgi:ABC-2 type transport system ATP-binding protein
MVLGLILPTAGEVQVLGRQVFGGRIGDRGEALRRVGAIVEEPAFWRYLSGRRNLEYFARAAGPAADRDRRLARIDEVLELVGLGAAARKKVKAYSQGMRQRLGIAQALLGEPELLVLDEPTNGLDPQGMREVRLLLRRLADGGTTVFVSSHLLAEVEAMCDRVGVLARGRLVAEGPPSSLRPTTDRLRIEVDDVPRAHDVLASLAGVSRDDETRQSGPGTIRLRVAPPASAASVNTALVAAGVGVSALVPEHESLEDVFVSLVEGADVPR